MAILTLRDVWDAKGRLLPCASGGLDAACSLDPIHGVYATLRAALCVLEEKPVDAVGGREAEKGVWPCLGLVEFRDLRDGVGLLR